MHIHVSAAFTEKGYPVNLSTDISFRDELGSVIIELDGPLAMRRVSLKLCEEVSRLLEAGRRKFILDLAGVPYADTAGVGALVFCHRAILAARGELTLVAPNQHVVQMLKRMRVDRFFTFGVDERAVLVRQ